MKEIKVKLTFTEPILGTSPADENVYRNFIGTQRNYIMKYYLEKMSAVEIAELYGVNKSTVSRTIRRGLDKAYGYLRFVSPLFIHQPKKRPPLSNGRKRIVMRKDGGRNEF